MHLVTDTREASIVAILQDPGLLLTEPQEVLDLIATVGYQLNTNKLVIFQENLPEDFFVLRTGLAGEILQKLTTYGVSIAIVGDFSSYESKALKDFIRESNTRRQTMFLPDLASALDALHTL